MNYLLPQEDSLIDLYLNNYHQRLSKLKTIFNQNKDTKSKINYFLKTSRKEIYFLAVIIIALIKHNLPLFYSDKHFLDSQTLSLLLIKCLDLDSIAILPENDSWEKDAYYTAARYYLEDYLLEEQEIEQTNNLNRVEGYLQAFENLCEIQDWKRAKKIINLHLESNTPLSLKRLFNILKNWGYDKKANDLYFKLWEYSYTNSDYTYFIELGNLLTSLNKYKNAIDCYLTALKITKKDKYFNRKYECHNSLGNLYNIMGHYQLAKKYHKKALQLLIDNKKLSKTLINFWHRYLFIKYISIICFIANLIERIITFDLTLSGLQKIINLILFSALLIFVWALYDDFVINRTSEKFAETLNLLGNVYFNVKKYEKARINCENALDYAVNKKNVLKKNVSANTLIHCLLSLGDICLQSEEIETSIIYYQNAYQIVSNSILINKFWNKGNVLNKLSVAYLTIGNYSETEKVLMEALSCFRKIEDKISEALTLNYLGSLKLGLGDYQESITYYKQSLSIYQEYENQASESVVINNLAIANEYLKNEQNKRNQQEN